MGDLLQADLDTLRRLGGTLAGHADTIGQLKISAAVTMPGSPIQSVSSRVDDAVIKAFGLIGNNIRQISDRSTDAADTYEEMDRANGDHLRRYNSGRAS